MAAVFPSGQSVGCTHPTIRCIIAGRKLKWSTIPSMRMTTHDDVSYDRGAYGDRLHGGRSHADSSSVDRPYNWFWIAGLWAGLGLLDATQNVFAMRFEGMHHSWAKLFFFLTFAWLPWALATPAVIHLGRKFPVAWKPLQWWLIHLGAIIAVQLVASAWASALAVLLQP